MTRRTLLTTAVAVLGSRCLAAPARFRNASAYNRAHGGLALLIMEKGQIVYEDYVDENPHDLASGTKSFWGPLSIQLKLDEPACQTLTEWRKDPRKASIRISHLLNLTSGLDPGSPSGLLDYREAIAVESIAPPGQTFLYGPNSFQCLGEVLRRKWGDPLKLLQKTLDVRATSWKRTPDGNPGMAWGAALTARQWAQFGEWVRLRMPEFQGTQANPCYGLGWWLNRPVSQSLRRAIPELARGQDLWGVPGIPADLMFASGMGKQRLFVSRQKQWVIVRQAKKQVQGYSDLEFLRTLL